MDRTLYLCQSVYHALQGLVKQGIALPENPVTFTPKAAKAIGKPHISLEHYARQVLAHQGVGVATDILAHQLLRQSVREWGKNCVAGDTAQSIAPSIRELFQAGADLKKLARHPSSRISGLASTAMRDQAKLRVRGLIDPSELFIEAKKRVQERIALIIYGYSNFSPDELAFLNTLAGEGSFLFIPYGQERFFLENQEAAMRLKDQGWTIATFDGFSEETGERLSRRFLTGATVPDNVQAHVYMHLEAEARGTLQQIKHHLLSGTPADEVVIVTGDEKLYGPMILAIAWEYGIPVRALYNIPLQETRIGSWIRLLLGTIQQRFPYEQALRLFSHPFSPCLGCDEFDKARRYQPQTLYNWRSLGIYVKPLDWPAEDTGRNWIACLEKVFNTLKVSQNIKQLPREVIAYQKLVESLSFLECADEQQVPMTQFISEVLEVLQLVCVPMQPGLGGVQLQAPESLFGARYRHVFIMGMAEGVLPSPVKNNTRLDFVDRADLIEQGINLRAIEKSASQKDLSFYGLLQVATESVTLSYPKLIYHKEALESPYFSRLNLETSPPALMFLGSLEEARRLWLTQEVAEDDPDLPRIRKALAVELNRESAPEFDEYDGVISLPIEACQRTFSVSELSTFGQCRFRWFAERVLNLSAPEEGELDLTPSQKGRLYHKVLELLGQWSLNQTEPLAVMRERLEEAFSQAETLYELTKLSAWDARRAEHLEVLRKIINFPAFLPEGNRLRLMETPFEGQWYGLTLRGIIDRIDEASDGLVFIDYKTSSSKPKGIQDHHRELKQDVQLPLYIEAATPQLFPGQSVDEAYYFSVTKGKVLARVKRQDIQSLEHFAGFIKESLSAGCFPVQPDTRQSACEYCDMDLVCRKGPRLSRKVATT